MARSDLELIQELDLPFGELAPIRMAVSSSILPKPQTVRQIPTQAEVSSPILTNNAGIVFMNSYKRCWKRRPN